MTENLLKLASDDLRAIAAAIRSRRLAAPYTSAGLSRLLSAALAESVAQELAGLAAQGWTEAQLATALELIIADRASRSSGGETITLVTTGPEAPGVVNRDTSVVARELFAHARESVLLAGYAVYQGRQVFQALADRMAELPSMRVRMFLDVQRAHGDTSVASELVRRFAHRFRTREWPAERPLPSVYYDSRSLRTGIGKRASLHAKCIVVDREAVFISSANFTEAAQERNIEIGLLVRSPTLAEQVERHFEALLAAGMVERMI